MKLFTFRFILFLCISSFFTKSVSAQTYCNPSMNCLSGYFYINNVTVGGVNNSAGAGNCASHNFITTTGDTITLTAGTTTSMSVTNTYYQGVGVYIDLNSDGNFNTAGEMLYTANPISFTTNTFNFTITAPSNTPTGYYRFRVNCPYSSPVPSATNACASWTYGTWQDYTVYIIGNGCDPGIVTQPLSVTRCAGGQDTLSVSAIGSNLNYQWMYNGSPISGANSSSYILTNITGANAGSYTCNVTNSSCSGAGTLSNAAVLTVNPLPTITAGGPTIFCPGSSVTLTSSAGTGNQWQLNGVNIYNATSNSYNASTPGIYNVVYTNGCPSTSAPDTISNYPAPNPVISPSGISGIVKICTGATQVFTTTTGTGWSYQWQRNGTSISGANGTSYIAFQSGSYTMTNTNSFGCTTVSTAVQLQVNTPPTSNISVIGSKILCAGGFKTLYASSSDPAATFQWQYNGANINGATTSTYNAYNPGNYSVISYNGCYVTSAALAISSLSFPTLTSNGPTTFCIGNNVKLTSSITDTSGVQYQWMRNGTNITNANSTEYIVTDSGTYQLLIIIDSACTAMSSSETVTVHPTPQPVVIATGNGYTLNTTQVYTTYQWYWNTLNTNLQPIPGATNYNLNVLTTGYYAVGVTDFNGCTGMSNPLKVTVIASNVNNVANNRDAIRIYPNPANSVIHISAPVKVNISISSLDGRMILQQNEATDINITGLACGMYIIRVNDANGNLVKVDKLIKN